MDKKTEALKLALEALEKTQNEGYNLPGSAIRKAITAIKEALAQPEQPDLDAICQDLQEKTYNQAMRIAELEAQVAQPEQEPVAWRWLSSKTWKQWSLSDDKKLVAEAVEWLGEEKVQPLYTTQQQRKPLTDEDLDKLADLHRQEYGQLCDAEDLRMFARAAIEAAHGITSKE